MMNRLPISISTCSDVSLKRKATELYTTPGVSKEARAEVLQQILDLEKRVCRDTVEDELEKETRKWKEFMDEEENEAFLKHLVKTYIYEKQEDQAAIVIYEFYHHPRFYRFYTDVYPLYKPLQGQSGSLKLFSLVKIQPFWVHSEDRDISQYTQREILDLIEGLDFHLFAGDIMFRDRTDEWKQQCKDLSKVAFGRAFHLTIGDEHTESVLNCEDYTESEPMPGVPGMHLYRTNERYLYEIEVFQTYFHIGLYKERDTVVRGRHGDVWALRKYLISTASRLDEREVVDNRKSYYESLCVSPCSRRVQLIRDTYLRNPKPSQILVRKHDQLVLNMVHCTTRDDVLCERPRGEEIHERISIDSLLVLICSSYKHVGTGDPLQALLGPGYPQIRRRYTDACWVLYLNDHEAGVAYPSLLEAFAANRSVRVKAGVRLDVFEPHTRK